MDKLENQRIGEVGLDINGNTVKILYERGTIMEQRPDFTYEQVVWIFGEIEKWAERYCLKNSILSTGEETKFLSEKDNLLKILAFDKNWELSFSNKPNFNNIPVKYRSYILNQDGTLNCPYCENLVKEEKENEQ
jgi:hypothetical protein